MVFNFYLDPFFWVLCAAFLLQLHVYLFIFRRLAAYKVKPGNAFTQPVTVIIAAKNEEHRLQQNLPIILEQDYPHFEVIVIDDQSEDETKYVLEAFEAKYKNLRVVTIKEHVNEFAGKKLALTLGIKAASHEYLLLTDADCAPSGNNWIRHMMSTYSDENTEVVLGFSPYLSKGSFLSAFIRFDTFYTALQYFSFALAGKPYMGVGRNLSYKKDVFFRNKGFAPYLKINSGDDDLFVNQVSHKNNTAIQLHPESFIWSEPKTSWLLWLQQKKRHMRTGKLYKPADKRRLSYLWLNNIFFYAAFILGVIFIKPFWVPLAIFGLRIILQFAVWVPVLNKLQMKNLWPLLPVMDVLYQLIYMPVMGLVGLFSKERKRW